MNTRIVFNSLYKLRLEPFQVNSGDSDAGKVVYRMNVPASVRFFGPLQVFALLLAVVACISVYRDGAILHAVLALAVIATAYWLALRNRFLRLEKLADGSCRVTKPFGDTEIFDFNSLISISTEEIDCHVLFFRHRSITVTLRDRHEQTLVDLTGWFTEIDEEHAVFISSFIASAWEEAFFSEATCEIREKAERALARKVIRWAPGDPVTTWSSASRHGGGAGFDMREEAEAAAETESAAAAPKSPVGGVECGMEPESGEPLRPSDVREELERRVELLGGRCSISALAGDDGFRADASSLVLHVPVDFSWGTLLKVATPCMLYAIAYFPLDLLGDGRFRWMFGVLSACMTVCAMLIAAKKILQPAYETVIAIKGNDVSTTFDGAFSSKSFELHDVSALCKAFPYEDKLYVTYRSGDGELHLAQLLPSSDFSVCRLSAEALTCVGLLLQIHSPNIVLLGDPEEIFIELKQFGVSMAMP